MSAPVALRIGILVPCRNEARVIERKLANLALAAWPGAAEHRIVVVDDQSEDDTLERARRASRELFKGARGAGAARVSLTAVANTVRPGKPGAIQQGLIELGSSVDLVVLSDADVVVEAGAIVALERAFAADGELAIACGAQRFVRDLADDGTCRACNQGDLVRADGGFDRATARVRALESRFGLLFSVHGQWLGWRANLDLAPRLGIAADDLDLLLAVRSRASGPWRARRIASATFYEVKTPPGPVADAQALRRARAYVQVLRASRSPARGLARRAQWLVYRGLPLHAPWSAAILTLALFSAAAAVDLRLLAVVVASALVLLALPPGRRLVRLLLLIRKATRLETRGALPERWEMARP